jgi:hypothetical protein
MRPEGQRILYYIGTTVGILGGLLGMTVAIIASPILGTIFTLFFIIVFGFAFGGRYLRDRKSKQLLTNGRRANGKIVELWDTGITINNQPEIGMVIEVTPETEPPFKAEVKLIISRLQTSFYQVGVSCIVKYDPNNKKTVAIERIGSTLSGMDSSTGGFGSYQNYSAQQGSPYFPGKNQQQIEDTYLAINMETKRILSVGVECKAIIKSVDNTNVFVNENYSLNAFVLEVIPDDYPAYEAKCMGIVMPASIPKYQPGKQIFVKYDPADRSKVSLFHS